MKKIVLSALSASLLGVGCMTLPPSFTSTRERPPVPVGSTKPVRAEDVSADNAHTKAEELAAELDRAEKQGDAQPEVKKDSDSKPTKKKKKD